LTTFFYQKIAPKVLFFQTKQSLKRPSHSLKLIFGTGMMGSIHTTDDSTLGGGLKLFFDTFMMWSHFDSS